MSDTASFVDPVYLNQFGLSRTNVLDYFLHPLNPFKTKATTSNEVLRMQGIDIFMLAAQGGRLGFGGGVPGANPMMNPQLAEDEYSNALKRLNGEQYELVPIPPNTNYNEVAQGPLFTIRHVLRSSPTSIKVLGIYYVLEGVIYKSPSVRSLMKSIVCKTIQGLSDACDSLSVCALYEPSLGYTWDFEAKPSSSSSSSSNKKKRKSSYSSDDEEFDSEEDDDDAILHSIMNKSSSNKRRKQRRILDNRRPGERTDEEEEGIRATEAINRILVRLSKSSVVLSGKGGSDVNSNVGGTAAAIKEQENGS